MVETVVDRLEGAPRTPRRRWSEAFKARLVAETLGPEANVSAIARCAGIAPSQLFGWRRQAIKNGCVTPVACDEPAPTHLTESGDGGGRTWATIATVLTTAKLNGVDPYAWLKLTLEPIAAGWPYRDVDVLMPWNHKRLP